MTRDIPWIIGAPRAPWWRRLRALFWSCNAHGQWSTLPGRASDRMYRRMRIRSEAISAMVDYCHAKNILPFRSKHTRGLLWYRITNDGRCAYCGGPPCDAEKHFG